MTTEQWGTVLVYFVAPAATLFPILYALTAPWWRSAVGRAVLTSKVGLAGLVDASLLFHWLGPDYRYRAEVVLVSFALIGVGTWLYLGALVHEQIVLRNARRAS